MSQTPNALTGHEYGIGFNDTRRPYEQSLPEPRLQGQNLHLNIPRIGDILQLPAQRAWLQLLSPALFPRLGWTYDLLVIPEHIYRNFFTIWSHRDPSEQGQKSIIRLAPFVFCAPVQIWDCVDTIRADPQSLLFVENLKETWSAVPIADQDNLRSKTRCAPRVDHSGSFSPSQPSVLSSASPSTTTDYDCGGKSSMSQNSGSGRNSLTKKVAGGRSKRQKRRRQATIEAYFCLVTDCTRKPEGYKKRKSCINHIGSEHAHLHLSNPEWKAKVCSEVRLVEVETESDPERSSQSSSASKKSRRMPFHQGDDIETSPIAKGSTAANTVQMGAGFQTHSPSRSSNSSPLFEQNTPIAMDQGNILHQISRPFVPFGSTLSQPFSQPSYRVGMFNNYDLSAWNNTGDNELGSGGSFNFIPPSRTSTPHQPPLQDPNRLSTASPQPTRSRLRY